MPPGDSRILMVCGSEPRHQGLAFTARQPSLEGTHHGHPADESPVGYTAAAETWMNCRGGSVDIMTTQTLMADLVDLGPGSTSESVAPNLMVLGRAGVTATDCRRYRACAPFCTLGKGGAARQPSGLLKHTHAHAHAHTHTHTRTHAHAHAHTRTHTHTHTHMATCTKEDRSS